MDYTNAMMVWDAVSVRITDVRHGAIAGGQSELTGENGLFIFVLGKDVRVTIEDVPYAPRGDALFHVGRGRRVRLDTTILEMVLMGRASYRKFYERDTAEDKQIAYNALRFMGMEDIANQHFSTLSGGEKQRVLIARSLAQEADSLVLDEPTNHLDVHYQWLLMEVIAGLKKTVLSVFHELNLACTFCDYLFVLKDGRIAAQGTPKEICTPQMLEEVFRVRADVLALEDGRPYIVYRGSIR